MLARNANIVDEYLFWSIRPLPSEDVVELSIQATRDEFYEDYIYGYGHIFNIIYMELDSSWLASLLWIEIHLTQIALAEYYGLL